MSRKTPRSISSVHQGIGVLLVLEFWFSCNNQQHHDCMLLSPFCNSIVFCSVFCSVLYVAVEIEGENRVVTFSKWT